MPPTRHAHLHLPISFQATTNLTPEGNPAAQATPEIDRTRRGILYSSGKLFHRLAGRLGNDHLQFQLRILTTEPLDVKASRCPSTQSQPASWSVDL